MQRRKSVRIAVAHVELVRELVDHDVVAGHALLAVAGECHVLVREDDRTAEPRLARHGIVGEVDHARLVDDLALGGELARVHDDLAPALEPFDAELEHEDAGLRRDLDLHPRRDFEPWVPE
jgi:hypothetical protein